MDDNIKLKALTVIR